MQYKEESVHYNLKKYLTSIKNSKEKLENTEFSIQKLTKAVILSAWYLENQQWSQTEYKYLNIDFFLTFFSFPVLEATICIWFIWWIFFQADRLETLVT